MTPLETYRGFVASQIAKARKEVGMTQAQVGQAIKAYLGVTWDKQLVSAIERGTRNVTVTELIALAGVLGHPPLWFLIPDVDDWHKRFEFGPGVTIRGDTLYLMDNPGFVNEDTYDMVTKGAHELERLYKRVEHVQQQVRKAEEAIREAGLEPEEGEK